MEMPLVEMHPVMEYHRPPPTYQLELEPEPDIPKAEVPFVIIYLFCVYTRLFEVSLLCIYVSCIHIQASFVCV